MCFVLLSVLIMLGCLLMHFHVIEICLSPFCCTHIHIKICIAWQTETNRVEWCVFKEKNLCSFYFLERWRPINNFLAVRNTMVNFLINKGSRYIITFSVHAAFALKIPIPCKKLSDIFKSKQFISLIHFLQ